jgi:energy-coupling factor transporter transmembrane protein EcfT
VKYIDYIIYFGIFVTFVLAFVTISKEYINRYVSNVQIIVLMTILILFSALVTAYATYNADIDKMYSGTSGKIQPNSHGRIYPCITLGGAGTVCSNGPGGLAISNGCSNSSDRIMVWVENGQLMISAVVRDKSGRVLATINGNEWDTATRPTIYDRNFDKNAVEVIDNYGKIVLQVNMVGENASVVGVFYGDNGTVLTIARGIITTDEIPLNVDRIFVYPSELHKGERAER